MVYFVDEAADVEIMRRVSPVVVVVVVIVIVVGVVTEGGVAGVALDVFLDESAAGFPRGEVVVFAFEAAPFGEMVGEVEGGGGGGGILVVDEGDGFAVRCSSG